METTLQRSLKNVLLSNTDKRLYIHDEEQVFEIESISITDCDIIIKLAGYTAEEEAEKILKY